MERHVIVIGGGFAGLAAARTLKEKSSARVTLLEAAPAVGGRAKTATLADGQKVELGATWLHGITGHPVYELALHCGLMDPHRSKGTDFWKGSQYLRQGQMEPLGEEHARQASHVISTFAETVDECQEHGRGTVGQLLRRKFQQLHEDEGTVNLDKDILVDAWGWRELLQRGIDGSDCCDDGLEAGLAEYEDLPGAWPVVTGGYQAVAERMAADLDDVRLGCEVEKLSWGPNGVEVAYTDGQAKQSLKADAAIVTVSLGVLKARHEELFQPPLPREKVGAVQRLGMGVVDKLFVTFPEVPEQQEAAADKFQLLWRQTAADLLPEESDGGGGVQEQWQRGVYSLRKGGSEFIQGKSPASRGEEETEEEDRVPSGNAPEAEASAARPSGRRKTSGRSWIAWIAGHHAVSLEKAGEAEMQQGFQDLLNFFPALTLPTTFQVTRSRWGMDPFTRGSYSYVSAAASPSDIDTLSEPLTAGTVGDLPVVCFAGEATSRKHIGTTAGAYFSGVREAERIIKAFGWRKQ